MVEETEEKNFLDESRQKSENLWRRVRKRRDMKKEYENKAFCYK